ncbi:hypothetical protein ACEU6E_03085 [Halorutilales archaeon Cl-col2-1]
MGAIRKGVVTVVVLAAVVVGGAVGSGYVLVGDPAGAVSQLATGDVEAPDIGVVTESVGPVDVPRMRITEISTSAVTLDIPFYVNNSANEIGGSVKSVDYDVYWADDEDGEYSRLGDGSFEDVRVPPSDTVTQRTEFEAQNDESAKLAGTLAVDGDVFVRIEGTAEIELGPFTASKDIPKQTTRIKRSDVVGGMPDLPVSDMGI